MESMLRMRVRFTFWDRQGDCCGNAGCFGQCVDSGRAALQRSISLRRHRMARPANLTGAGKFCSAIRDHLNFRAAVQGSAQWILMKNCSRNMTVRQVKRADART